MLQRIPAALILFSLGAPLVAAPIRSSEAVSIGGIRQWISIEGADSSLPVLLFLHGGPGNSVMGYADKFTRDLKKRFVVVQWDQRESGKTARLNSSDKKLTVALLQTDAVEMVMYLSSRFSKEKIYVVGHSWGGFLALELAAAIPDLLAACVAMSPMVNQWESERQTLDWLLTNARAANNGEAIRELSLIRVPFENPDQLYYHRRWLLLSQKKKPASKDFVRKWGRTWFSLYKEACDVNLFETLPEIKCPVYFFLGSSDRQASSTITEAYYKALKAEKKDLIWFTNSAHSLNLTEPKKMQEIVISLLDSGG